VYCFRLFRHGYDGRLEVEVAEGSGVRDELVVEPDTLGTELAVEVVAEPTEAGPIGASEMGTMTDEEAEAGEGVYTPESGEACLPLARTTPTAMEVPRRARMQMRMTNQCRRQKEGERTGFKWGGTKSEVDE
jgi:hypothetical protein